MSKCYFTYNIMDIIECSKTDNFDFNGISHEVCQYWPCIKWLHLEPQIGYELLGLTTA